MAMRDYNNSGVRNFDAAEAIPRHRLVKYGSAGTITLADLGEDAIGVSEAEAFASGENIGVRLINKAGTVALEANGAFAVNAVIYGTANGRVDDVATSAVKIGRALTAATAAGDIVEVLIDKNAA